MARSVAVLFLMWCLPATVLGGPATNVPSGSFTVSLTTIFPNSEVAVHNGSNLVTYVASGQAEKARNLIGKDVALYGGGPIDRDVALRHGGTAAMGYADLVTDEGIFLKIDIQPPQDVRPHAVAWGVCVLGTVTNVDVQRKVIRLKVRADNWLSIIES